MSIKSLKLILAACMALAAGLPAYAGQFGDAQPEPLKNGINHVTLGGHEAMVLVAERANFNAHDFTVTTIYMEGPSAPSSSDRLMNIVPAFNDDPKEQYERLYLLTGGGADCVLHDFRILASTHSKRTWLVRAERDMKLTFADAEPVHFDVYRLEENPDATPGRPTVYFEFDHRIQASKVYCDVDEAMNKELGFQGK
jgi:hypothetical protein